MSETGLKTDDLDLDLQGQFGFKLKNFVRFLVTATNFKLRILTSNLICVLIISRSWIILKTCDLDHDGQIGLQTCKIFVLSV